MIKEAVGTGITLDEAKENALIALGAAADDDVQFEIIDTPRKKVLGMFGGTQAKVRVFVELPDEKENVKKHDRKKENKKPKNQSPKEKQPEKAKPAKSADSEYGESVDAGDLDPGSKAYGAAEYLKKILTGFGLENTAIKVAQKENGALLSLEGEGLGAVIGRRGETLEALQILVSLSVNNGGGYYRVSITVGDYREKREKALTSLASRMARQVLSTGKNRTLEPMSPYERRIIHTAVQEIEGVESNSVGEGDDRRVVIHPAGKTVDETRYMRRPRSRGGRSSGTVRSSVEREPLKDSDIPLYGKIER